MKILKAIWIELTNAKKKKLNYNFTQVYTQNKMGQGEVIQDKI